MAVPVKITSDLRLIVEPDAPPLSGSQALDLGKRLIEKGAAAVAREAVGWPQRGRARREVEQCICLALPSGSRAAPEEKPSLSLTTKSRSNLVPTLRVVKETILS
jgi:hypothetical protein